jgi:hypothetical protein
MVRDTIADWDTNGSERWNGSTMNIGYIVIAFFGSVATLMGLAMIIGRRRLAKNMQGVRGYDGITPTGVVAFGSVSLCVGVVLLTLLFTGVIVPPLPPN